MNSAPLDRKVAPRALFREPQLASLAARPSPSEEWN
jgi:hypothetical protein